MSQSTVRDLLQIFKSSVFAVLPGNLIRKSLKYCELTEELTVGGKKFDLQNKNVHVIGAGKAVKSMAIEVEKILNSKIKTGIISIPIGGVVHNSTHKNIVFYEGAKNNLPDVNAVFAARKIDNLATALKIDDFLLVLISGGGSALLSLPKEHITLEEKIDLIKRLSNSGADIKELNTVRKRLSDLKGGQLAIKAYPATVVSLILSDIVGDPLHLIASGPTTEDEDDTSGAMNVINKYGLQNHISDNVMNILSNPPDYYKKFPKDNVHNFLIGSNKISTEAAVRESKTLEYEPIVLSNAVTGNIKDVARQYVTLTKQFCDYLNGDINLEALKINFEHLKIPGFNCNIVNHLDNSMIKNKDFCLILGGEITVQVTGTGKGGRNQQLALEFSNLLHHSMYNISNYNIYILCAGTDGIDGPTDAAGAIGYQNLVTDAENDELNVNKYLDENDSYNFYKSFRNGTLHVVTNHTNTNVMDIHIIIIKRIKI